MEELVYAGSDEGCGLAALKMMLIHHQRDRSYAFLPLKEGSYDLEALRQAAEREGLSLEWKRAKRKEDLAKERDFPLLLLLQEGKRSHLVYLQGKGKKGYRLFDPAKGKRLLSFEELSSLWGGVYARGKLLRKKRPAFSHPRFLPLSFCFLSLAVNLLSLGSLFVSFLFFKEGSSPLFPLLFLACFGAFNLLSRLLSLQAIRRFDEKHLSRVLDESSPKNFEANYAHFNTFKRLLFERFKLFGEGSMAFFSLLFLFGINSLAFLYSAILQCLFSLLFLLFAYRPWRKGADALEEKERSALSRGDKNGLLGIAKESAGLAGRLSWIRAGELLVLCFLAFLPAFLENRVELNFYLLNLFGLLTLEEALRAFGRVILSDEAYLRERARFLPFCAR